MKDSCDCSNAPLRCSNAWCNMAQMCVVEHDKKSAEQRKVRMSVEEIMACDPKFRPKMDEQAVAMLYTNYRGVREQRVVLPLSIFFGTSEYHSEPQWLMQAYDFNREALRSFAMNSIHTFHPYR